jgi:hypothetical protein
MIQPKQSTEEILLSGFKYDQNIDYTRDKTIDIGPRSICK